MGSNVETNYSEIHLQVENASNSVEHGINAVYSKAQALTTQLQSLLNHFNTNTNLSIGSLPNLNIAPILDGSILENSTLNNSVDNIKSLISSIENEIPKAITSLSDIISDIKALIDGSIDSTITIPSFSPIPAAPAIKIPSPPVFKYTPFTENISVLFPKFPDALSLSDIQVPNLLNVTIPSEPFINIPDVPEEKTFSDVADPVFSVIYSDENYTDNIVRLKTAIDTFLNGGVDTEFTAIEKGFIERGYTELDEQYKADIFEEQSRAERLGYTIPSGVILHRLELERTKYLKNVTALQNEVNKNMAELANRNRNAALNSGTTLEQAYMNLFIQKMTRKFEYYKSNIDKELRLFDSKLKKLSTSVEVYKNTVLAYSERLKGELSKIDVFKAKLDGQKIISDINNAILEKYKTQLQAHQVKADIYKTQVATISEQIKGEISKVDIFKAKIDAYTAKLNGEKIKSEIYKTQIDSESSKINIFETQVKAYLASVEAAKVSVSAQSEKINAELKLFESKVKATDTLKDVYIAEVESTYKFNTIKQGLYEVISRLYTALLSPIGDYLRAQATIIDTNTKSKIAEYEGLVKKVLAEAELKAKGFDLDINKTKAMLDATATLAAAYANSINYSCAFDGRASIQYDGSDSERYDTSLQVEA